MELTVLALALVAGVDARRTLILGLALLAPLSILALAVWVVWRSRGSLEARSAVFCEAAAADLRAGTPLRDSLVHSAQSAIGEAWFAAQDAALSEVVDLIAGELDDIGPELTLTVNAAHRTGARVADLLDEIGAVAIARSEIAREVRVASAPARATALLFVLVPVFYFVMQIRNGSLIRLLSMPQQRLVAVAGLLLFMLGVGIAGLLLWRAS